MLYFFAKICFNNIEVLNTMKDGYVQNHPKKTIYSLREVIVQVMPDNNSTQTTENYYRHKIRLIEPVLKVLGVDINLYKTASNRYKIPVILAELIYVIALEAERNSSQDSNISFLKYEEFDKISIEDRMNLLVKFFDEIAKDFPELKPFCETSKYQYLTSYKYYIEIDMLIDKLKSVRDSINLPIITFDEKYATGFVDIFDESLENGSMEIAFVSGEITTLNKNNTAFNEIHKYLWGITGNANTLPYWEDIFKTYRKIFYQISKIEKMLAKIQ